MRRTMFISVFLEVFFDCSSLIGCCTWCTGGNNPSVLWNILSCDMSHGSFFESPYRNDRYMLRPCLVLSLTFVSNFVGHQWHFYSRGWWIFGEAWRITTWTDKGSWNWWLSTCCNSWRYQYQSWPLRRAFKDIFDWYLALWVRRR